MKLYIQPRSLETPEALQSATIDFLRFPLALAVIFIHYAPQVVNLQEADFPLLSGQGLWNVLGIAGSHVLGHLAVPVFFLLSGFLFFRNFPEWHWEGYRSKLKSRWTTLVKPYLLWNLVPWALIVGLYAVQGACMGGSFEALETFLERYHFNILTHCEQWNETQVDWLGQPTPLTGPFDLPLWFLRELIVLSVLTPVVYAVVKRGKAFAVGLLGLAYVSRIWIQVPGLDISACFFFTWGAYLALNRLNLVTTFRRVAAFVVPLTVLLGIATVYYDGPSTRIGQLLLPAFIVCGVPFTLWLAARLVEKYRRVPGPLLLSSCFFLYAFHWAPVPYLVPLDLCKNLVARLIPGDTLLESYVSYLGVPLLTAALCIGVLQLGRRWLPRLITPFAGGR